MTSGGKKGLHVSSPKAKGSQSGEKPFFRAILSHSIGGRGSPPINRPTWVRRSSRYSPISYSDIPFQPGYLGKLSQSGIRYLFGTIPARIMTANPPSQDRHARQSRSRSNCASSLVRLSMNSSAGSSGRSFMRAMPRHLTASLAVSSLGKLSPIAFARAAPMAWLALFTGSSARCAYRAVVETLRCPKILPITGSPRPAPAPVAAWVCRRSWRRT